MSWYKIEKYIKIGALSHELKAIEEEHDKQIRAEVIEEFVERVEKTDINSSNYPMNQVNLVKMQMLKEKNK